jgi:hypothetical protein
LANMEKAVFTLNVVGLAARLAYLTVRSLSFSAPV